MSLFTLPIPPGLVAPAPRARSFRVSRSKKRKRASSPSPSVSSDDDKLSLARDHNSLPAASTNPLSLTPSEVLQYRLAGLELDEDLPSTTVRDFPHRGLPPDVAPPRRQRSKSRSKSRDRSSTFDTTRNQDVAQEDPIGDEKKPQERGPRLRTHHWGVLTTVLHKCLLDGDIPRASRAWALLLRAEIAGKGIEIRQSGYWGIGAELLIRSQEAKGKAIENGEHPDGASTDDKGNDAESASSTGDKRWGTSAGIARAKEYFERLILQHPYMRQYHGSVTALDFWPAMFGCEIYGIQFEHKETLRKISKEEEDEDEDEPSSGEESGDDEDEDEEEGRENRRGRRRISRREKRWKERDEIRSSTLVASEKVAARMDELMTNLPYSESHVFLRLRGMLALYIADLYVPDLLEGDDSEETLQDQARLGPQVRAAKLKREKAYENGRRMQEEERARAKGFLEKLAKEGGRVGIDLRALSPDPEPEEDEDEESSQSKSHSESEDEYSRSEDGSDEGKNKVVDRMTDVAGDDSAANDTDESVEDVYEDNRDQRNAFNERDSGSDTDT